MIHINKIKNPNLYCILPYIGYSISAVEGENKVHYALFTMHVTNMEEGLKLPEKVFDRYDCISPLDYRYAKDRVARDCLSENAFTRWKLRVEVALVVALCKMGRCDQSIVDEVRSACLLVTPEEVSEEEDRIHHDIRALANCILRRVSERARPFVHLAATSFDISDTARACQYRHAVLKLLVPGLVDLVSVLIEITEREAGTIQIGRTHGQHAVPITFGFAIAGYVSELGGCVLELEQRAQLLPGKFSGAVGAYNASSLFFDDPCAFEGAVLADVGLKALDHSTQIVQHGPVFRLAAEIVHACGIMANLANDMRQLQRTEIAEVGEVFEKDQVGSSTMPNKRNPINFENVCSILKIVIPRLMTVATDIVSEHQRDLTNSASGRTFVEIIAYVYEAITRLTRVMKRLHVDKVRLEANLAMTKGAVLAEPMQLILADHGHPNAHEVVRQLTLEAERSGETLMEVFSNDEGLASYRDQLSDKERCILSDPAAYVGIAPKRAYVVAAVWRLQMKELQARLA